MDALDSSVWLFVIIVGATVIAMAFGLAMTLGAVEDKVQQRIDSSGKSVGKESARVELYRKIVGNVVMPKKKNARSSVSEKLRQAGYDSETASYTFYLTKVILSIAICPSFILLALLRPPVSGALMVSIGTIGAVVGWWIPNIVLDQKIGARKEEIVNGFPDALDLLVSCTEAGLGLNSALQRVSDELDVVHPALASELGMVNIEIRAGIDRMDALKNLSNRTGVEDIRGLVALLCQCSKFGSPIADALREYSLEFRDIRMQRAEEASAKISTKMIFPMTLCIFPVMFIVAVGPAVIGAITALSGK